MKSLLYIVNVKYFFYVEIENTYFYMLICKTIILCVFGKNLCFPCTKSIFIHLPPLPATSHPKTAGGVRHNPHN